MIDIYEKTHYWKKFFYDKEEYLRRSLAEVSDIKIDNVLEVKEKDMNWKVQWEELLNRNPENSFSAKKPSFVGFIERFLIIAKDLLGKKELIQSTHFNLNENFFNTLFLSLSNKIIGMSYKVLIQEVNILRDQGLLLGETSEKRYEYFESLLYSKEYLTQLTDKYPVLIRSLIQVTRKWTIHVSEVLNRFENDYPKILLHMPEVQQFGKVVHIHIGAGDTHDGRSVTILEFADGDRLVYKPRSLQVDTGYYRMMSWMFEKGIPVMKVVKNIDCGDYGWTEFVKFEECKSEQEVKLFYYGMGVQLAMMYVFNATDFHYENIIAHGGSPVLIDLESLFHSPISTKTFEKDANGHAYEILSNSVMSSGMLPQYAYKTETHSGLDVSGIFGHGGKKVPNAIGVINRGTDLMRLEKGNGETEKTQNLPHYQGEVVDSYKHIEEIEKGFVQAYKIIAENKVEVESMIRQFASVRVRVIVRDTRAYGELMRTLCHPDLLQNELDRKIVLHRLWLPCLANSKYLRLVSHEMRDIEEGDIPIFYTYPAEKDIWSSDHKKIPCMFDESGLNVAIKKIRKMDDRDLKEQLQVLHMSILASNPHLYKPFIVKARPKDSTDTLQFDWRKEYVRLAVSIGENMLQTAITSRNSINDDATWIGLIGGHNERQLRLVPVGYDLYDGNSGIALFFAYLAELTAEDKYKDMALKVLRPLIEIMKEKQSKEKVRSIGAFDTGTIGGGVFAVYHLARLWGEESLLQVVKQYLPYYCDLVEQDTVFDYIGGSAGAIDILLHLYRGTGWIEALKGAEKCAEHLLENVRIMSDGSMAWSAQPDQMPYVGYSHGVSGIIAALSSLYRETRNEKYIPYIAKGLQYERANYDEELKNWMTPGDTARVTWCHGAPGVLLARLRLIKNGYWDSEIDKEIECALETTIRSGFSGDPLYCHGDFGQLEILLFANTVLERDVFSDRIDAVRMRLLELLKDQPWTAVGAHRAFDRKGLMAGLAGVGFGLLKQAFPDKVANILSLDNDDFLAANSG